MRLRSFFALGQLAVAAAASLPSNDVTIVRTTGSQEDVDAIARALAPISLGRRDTTFQSNVTSLNQSWSDAILYTHKV
jgi:hypothetical protein